MMIRTCEYTYMCKIIPMEAAAASHTQLARTLTLLVVVQEMAKLPNFMVCKDQPPKGSRSYGSYMIVTLLYVIDLNMPTHAPFKDPQSGLPSQVPAAYIWQFWQFWSTQPILWILGHVYPVHSHNVFLHAYLTLLSTHILLMGWGILLVSPKVEEWRARYGHFSPRNGPKSLMRPPQNGVGLGSK